LPKVSASRSSLLLTAAMLAFGANAAFGLPAHAETPFRANIAIEVLFTAADVNDDGKIDASEIAAARAKRFDRFDTNGDGAISQVELKQAGERLQRRAALIEDITGLGFENLDTNGDDAVSREEFLSARLNAIPLLADIDGDGMISKDEVRRVIAALPAFQ
jgi:Ca2+-binding EF-hand superfamily protein